jgi:hypothetical protein
MNAELKKKVVDVIKVFSLGTCIYDTMSLAAVVKYNLNLLNSFSETIKMGWEFGLVELLAIAGLAYSFSRKK